MLELYAIADGESEPGPVIPRIVLDNFSPHLIAKTDQRVREFVEANNVELAHVPFYASWLNRIEAQFTALRYFALDGTDHNSHEAQARMIRRYIAWPNRNAKTLHYVSSSSAQTVASVSRH